MRGLYALKPWYTRRLSVALRGAVARGACPDLLTGLGVGCAALAVPALAYSLWPLALLLLAGRLAGANLDGAVARARGVSRPYGFVLNEVGDRVSDLLLFAGLALLAVRTGTPLWLVVLAGAAAQLPTFVSLSAAGAGGTRHNGGPLGKTERCALGVLACAVPGWLPAISAVVVAGSLLTAALRLQATRDELVTA
jgi:CDP-diacylglycerol--glycerol-3-phosphate 3-phosphatidyltransferase